MKTSFFYIICFFLFSAITGCNSTHPKKTTPSIQLNPTQKEKLQLSNFDTEVIQLETTKNSMLKNIQKAFVDYENDRIFILSQFNLFLFHLDGTYIKKLSVGRGPGEVLQLSSFTVNKVEKTISVLDMGRDLSFYDYSGNFIKKNRLESFYSMDAFYKDKENLFLVCKYVGGSEKYFVGNYNIETNKITKKHISSSKSPYDISTNLLMPNSFSYSDNNLLFFSPSIFGLFELNGENFKQILKLDIEERMPPLNFANKLLLNNRSAFRDEAKQRGYIPQLLYAFCFNDYYFVGVDDNEFSCYAINKKNVNDVFYEETIAKYFNLPKIKSLQLPIGFQKDCIIFSCNPSDFFEDITLSQKTIKLNNKSALTLNIDDNPFLVVIK